MGLHLGEVLLMMLAAVCGVAQPGWQRLKGGSPDSSLPQFLPQKEGSQDTQLAVLPRGLKGLSEVWQRAPACWNGAAEEGTGCSV